MEMAYPGRRFTPDGHIVGSMGEVIAAERYVLSLLPASAETHYEVPYSGKMVQASKIYVPERNRLIVDTWLQYVKDKRAIVLCASVKHAEQIAELFRELESARRPYLAV